MKGPSLRTELRNMPTEDDSNSEISLCEEELKPEVEMSCVHLLVAKQSH